MKQFESPRLLTNVIAVFGAGNLVKEPSGKLELHGGTHADLIEAREWASLFMPEAIVCRSSRACSKIINAH